MSLKDKIDWKKCRGLIPAIVQDSVSGRVLMLGYMDTDALTVTEDTGNVTFYSRSRRKLWTKGEQSGNSLSLVDMRLDCDGDALLVQASPSGPACHRGYCSCFDGERRTNGFGFLGKLEHVIRERHEHGALQGSYTARLLHSGTRRIAQKVGEEGIEVALAAVSAGREEIVEESADLLYHMMVMLRDQNLEIADIAQALHSRHEA